MNAEIKMHRGAMTLFLDDQPFPFTTYKPTELDDDVLYETTVKRSVKDLSQRGVRIYFVPIFFDWPAEGLYDFSRMDWRINTLLGVFPEAYILIRIQADSMEPQWWLDGNPDGVCRHGIHCDREIAPAMHATHPSPSLASNFWKTAGNNAIEALAEHVKQQDYADQIIGYLPTSYNSNEWFFRTYSELRVTDLCPAMQSGFKDYLQRKTGLEKEFTVPDRVARDCGDVGYFFHPDAVKAAFPVVAYYRYINTLCAQTILNITSILRRVHAPRRMIIGTFYGYAQGLANFFWLPESGHLALERLLEQDGPDFTCSPLEYFSRNFREELSGGFCWSQSAAVDSARIAGKGYFAEDDFAPPLENKRNWSSAEDDREDAELMKRNFVFSLCKGQLMWWYDLVGHWFESKQRLDTIEKCVNIAKNTVNYDRNSISEVAVVMDERASWYVTLDKTFQRATFWENFYHGSSKIGAPVDLLLLGDIAKVDMKKYKAVFFPTCFCLNNQDREIINSLKSEGRSLIFYQASGLINPDCPNDVFDPSNIKFLTGINVERTDMIFQLRLATGNGHPLLEGFQDKCFGTHLEKNVNFYVDDAEAQSLAYYSGRGLTGYAVKLFDGWKSFYCAVPGMPFYLVRNILKDANVHLYCQDNDIIYANKSYLGIFVLENVSEKVLTLPGEYCFQELFENNINSKKPKNKIHFTARRFHTYLFKLGHVD